MAKLKGPGALAIIDEAFALLRTSSRWIFLVYYAGTLPFVLAFLYFWMDMSHGAAASGFRSCTAEALGLSLLYLWMKLCQAVFSWKIQERMKGLNPEPLGWRKLLQAVVVQAALQTSSFFLLLPAFLITIPFGYVYAFYNHLADAAAQGGGLRESYRKSWNVSLLWPGQNHLMFLWIFLFESVVFVNLAILIFMLPELCEVLLGVQGRLTLSPMSFFNTTFLTLVFGMTYLLVNPLVRASYGVRFFYGQSMHSGEDLLGRLRRVGNIAGKSAVVLLLLCLSAFSTLSADAVPALPETGPGTATVTAPELDRSIQEVLSRSEYRWRFPRHEEIGDKAPDFLGGFLDDSFKMIGHWIEAVFSWIGKGVDWLGKEIQGLLEKYFPKRNEGLTVDKGNTEGWVISAQALVFVCLAASLCFLVILSYRYFKKREKSTVAAVALALAVDISREDISPDLLPTEGWLDHARDFMGKGEWRLAVRAAFLSILSLLSQAELIELSRSKSNRDYLLELRRRASSRPELPDFFTESLEVFEKVWYGLHEVDKQAAENFLAGRERIRSGV